MTNPVVVLARFLRCTEGQAYTVLIGLVVATLLAIGGVPAVLQSHRAATTATTPATTTGTTPVTTHPADRTQRGANP
jgi:hypothetical protein